MWQRWADDVWILIIAIAAAWELVGILFKNVPTLSELVTELLNNVGPYGRLAFVIIWAWLAWHFLTGRILAK